MDTTVIYIDTLFIINFCLDIICLYATAAICRKETKLTRLIFGGSVGGVYAVISVYIETLPTVLGYLLHIAAASMICITVFGFTTIRMLLKQMLSFWAVSLLSGGAVLSVCFISGNYAQYGKALYFDFGGDLLIITTVLLFGFIYIFARIISERLAIKSTTLFVTRGKNEIAVEALYDSGNLLTDTLTASPVAIVKSEKLTPLFGKLVLSAIAERRTDDGLFPVGLRFIPTANGILAVFSPDKVFVLDSKTKKRKVSVLIGIDFTPGTFAGMYALMPIVD